jgi:tRNA uridine 5-carbamoylmethylation protein Kti12
MTKVTIMSGPPGSGKSFQTQGYATVLDNEGKQGIIVSADHYFCPELMPRLAQTEYFGIPFNLVNSQTLLLGYEFDPSKLPMAHQQCMRGFIAALTAVKSLSDYHIIVDNTNINSVEIAPYYLVGEALGAEVEILRVEAELDVCIQRNVHGVPDEVITRMWTEFKQVQDHPWEEGVMIPKQHMPWWTSRSA